MTKNNNHYVNFDLREQIYLECKSMAGYALAKGKSVPVKAIQCIESFEDRNGISAEGCAPKIQRDLDITALVETHDLLAKLIDPAAPQTILLLDTEQATGSIYRILGPVSLVRELMLATIISLIFFVGLMSSPLIDADKLAEDVLKANGIEQLARLIFYIAAAGLGASFAALHKANGYISNGTFDPTHQSSYWIRFSLGIIAGLLLSILVSESSIQGGELLSKGIIRPLLAILGGFSADLLYAFLNRMVETFKSLFENSTRSMLEAKAIEAKAKQANMEVEARNKLAQSLMDVQSAIATDMTPEQVKQQLNTVLQDLMKSK